MSTRSVRRRIGCALILLLALSTVAQAAPNSLRVKFVDERTGELRTLDGRLLVEAEDGGILLEDRAGVLWTIQPDMQRSQETLETPYSPYTAAELAEELLATMGSRFSVEKTRHYVLCSSADPEFTRWVGTLFERLLQSFLGTWRRAGLELHEPRAPLVAMVFASREEFARFASRDADAFASEQAGYYSIRTNRIVLFDLAAASGQRGGDVSRRVAAAPANVATIVHEAAHQIAFNCGMHTRYADNPTWLAEGMAMYCETPDLRTGSGWTGIGKLNLSRLRRFQTFAATERQPDSLRTLLRDAERFQDREHALNAYAESWALVYFLARSRREEYAEYLEMIADKPRLRWETPEERLQEFEAAFGPLAELEPEFRRYIERLGKR